MAIQGEHPAAEVDEYMYPLFLIDNIFGSSSDEQRDEQLQFPLVQLFECLL